MVSQARLDKSGHIHLSPEACERLGWQEGDALVVEETNRGLLIRRAVKNTDEAPIGEAGEKLAAETWPADDFSSWESGRG